MDGQRLDRMLDILRRYTEELERLRAYSRDVFVRDAHRVGSAKYHFVVAIECCIDIAHHFIASRGLRIPSDNADAFSVLLEAAIRPPQQADSYRAMARFGNRLVHLYWEVSDEGVYEYPRDHTEQLRDFASAAGRAGVQSGGEPPAGAGEAGC